MLHELIRGGIQYAAAGEAVTARCGDVGSIGPTRIRAGEPFGLNVEFGLLDFNIMFESIGDTLFQRPALRFLCVERCCTEQHRHRSDGGEQRYYAAFHGQRF